MNRANDTFVQRLEAAAREGNIDLLYGVIDEKPDVLEHWDVKQFSETPLHIAASAGHLHFATEIMRMKPSFSLKLNKQGFSPIHLALQQGQTRMAMRFVDINKDLVRVKGREGATPLHLVSQNGDINLLAYFLSVCPDSIVDVTVRSETALHIAVKNRKHEALEFLVGWLKTTCQRDAIQLEKEIMSWQDEEGNTILHISAHFNDNQALEWLIYSGIDLQAKNIADSTALDIAATEEIKDILVKAGAKNGSSIGDESSTLLDAIRSFSRMKRNVFIDIRRFKADMTENQRSACLVVATLIAGISYQIVGNPPGGFYQANGGGGDKNNTCSFNTTAPTIMNGQVVGTSLMPVISLIGFLTINALVFFTSLMAIIALIPNGRACRIMSVPITALSLSFSSSMFLISPTILTAGFWFSVSFGIFALDFILDAHALKWGIKSWNGEGRNRW